MPFESSSPAKVLIPFVAAAKRVVVSEAPKDVFIDVDRSWRRKRSASGQPAHAPLWQVLPAGHLMAQAPQLSGSVDLSTHSAPHALAGGQTQAPLWHEAMPGQTAPSSIAPSQSLSLPSQCSGAPWNTLGSLSLQSSPPHTIGG